PLPSFPTRRSSDLLVALGRSTLILAPRNFDAGAARGSVEPPHQQREDDQRNDDEDPVLLQHLGHNVPFPIAWASFRGLLPGARGCWQRLGRGPVRVGGRAVPGLALPG